MYVRPVRDKDAPKLLALVGRCFAEYEGVVLEPEGIDADLNHYASVLEKTGGEGYVVDRGEDIVALVACVPSGDDRFELKRFYLDQDLRGSGIASKLLRLVEGRARTYGAQTMELWSDTRFERAHRFYEREGFARQEHTRALGDSSNSIEYQYIKALPRLRAP